MLYTAARIADGEIPYRDMSTGVTPGCYYIVGGVYSLFGVSVHLDRLVLLVFDIASLLAMYSLASRLLPLSWAAVTTLLMIPLSFAHFHYNQSHYNWYALTFQLFVVVILVNGIGRLGRRRLFATGLLAFLAFFMSQRSGVLTWCGVTAYLLSRKIFAGSYKAVEQSWRECLADVLAFHAGLLTPLAAYLAYLGFHGVPPAQFFDWTFGWLLHFARTMFVVLNPFADWLAMVIYLFAVLVLIIGCRLLLRFGRRRDIDEQTAILSVFAFFLFFGIFPTVGFHHLIFVDHLPVLLVVVAAHRFIVKWEAAAWYPLLKFGCALALTAVFVLGSHRAVQSAGRWDSSPGGMFEGVKISRRQSDELVAIRDCVREHSTKDDYILALPFDLHLNVWCERRAVVPLILGPRPFPGHDELLLQGILEHPPKMFLYNDSSDVGATLGLSFESFKRWYPRSWRALDSKRASESTVGSYRVFVMK